MKTYLGAIGLAATLALGLGATAASAQQTPNILELKPGMCQSSRDVVMNWARDKGLKGAFGAFAMPTQRGTTADCSILIDADSGYAGDFNSLAAAEAAAMNACKAANASRTTLGPCVIVARLTPGAI